MITTEHEHARSSTGEGFADAVTFSFADSERGWFGLARLGIADGSTSALSVLFQGRDPISALARGGEDPSAGASWTDHHAHGLRATIDEPLERWRLTFEGHEQGFDLTFTAISAPAEIGEGVARAGGMHGYEQFCSVEGTVHKDGETHEFGGLGQRGHTWGAPDWSGLELTRSVSAWLGPDHGGLALTTVRPAGSESHAEETVWATLVEGGEPIPVADPRMSTTYDADGRQRRAGVELWVNEDDGYPYRAAGEILCGSTLDLGHLRMDLAFIRWHAEGREGVGRYDVLRRT